MMTLLRTLVVALVVALAAAAHAVQPDEVLADPAQEARARALSKELRCMVCQNQSIDDSDAPLARDLRLLVRERIQAGDSDTKVIEFLTARYGEFVLLKPRFSAATAFLWFAPMLALLAGAVGVVIAFRRRSLAVESAEPVRPLSADEQARLDELLRRSAK